MTPTPTPPAPATPRKGPSGDAREPFEREVWTLQFRSAGVGPPTDVRIARLLKMALRGYGLRCCGYGKDKP